MPMTVDQAIDHVGRRFPFDNYLETLRGGHRTVAKALQSYLPAGASILDFGCGPCDKTAVAQALGYKCSAIDDLNDDWHHADGNREKIIAFAKAEGIDFRLATDHVLPFRNEEFDMVMMHDVLEHLHDSPRELINDLLSLTKPGGLFFATVPSAVNIRKRLDVLMGRTNLPNFDGYYWYPGPWRGHIREYTRDDLAKLCEFLSLDIVKLGNCHHMLHRLHPMLKPAYLALTSVFPNLSDSLIVVGRKRPGWTPRKSLSEAELRTLFGRIPNCPHYLYQ